MIVGVGVLGTLAATIATAFIDLRERGRKGLRSYRMDDHLLILGWNQKALAAIDDFRFDPRHEATQVVVVADLPETPIDDPGVRFVRGQPGKLDALDRASARGATVAIAFASDPTDPRSDHETAMIVLALREVNPEIRISAELVHPDHKEFLLRAGCDSVIDSHALASTLLVRSAQDLGVAEVVEELLTNKHGSEILSHPRRRVRGPELPRLLRRPARPRLHGPRAGPRARAPGQPGPADAPRGRRRSVRRGQRAASPLRSRRPPRVDGRAGSVSA